MKRNYQYIIIITLLILVLACSITPPLPTGAGPAVYVESYRRNYWLATTPAHTWQAVGEGKAKEWTP